MQAQACEDGFVNFAQAGTVEGCKTLYHHDAGEGLSYAIVLKASGQHDSTMTVFHITVL